MNISGYNLSEGTIPFSQQSDDDVIRIINLALSPAKKHTSSYKYAFFKAILDNIFNVDLKNYFLSYDAISLRFTEIYWNLSLRFHLKQMPSYVRGAQMTYVERKLFAFCEKYGFDYSEKNIIFPFESLRSDLQVEINKQIRSIMLKNVIGAFYADTEGQLYSFSKKDSGIWFNPDSYKACVKYKSDFEKINYYEWIKYLEKVNSENDSYALANKLDESTERNDLHLYRNALQKFGQVTCFYCHKPLFERKNVTAPVDHCIPWSFVKDDKIWNFVLACSRCNSIKSSNLPDETYIDDIIRRNSYLQNVDLKLIRDDFKSYSHSRLHQMYKSAIFNGFQFGWKPKNVVQVDDYKINNFYKNVASDGIPYL